MWRGKRMLISSIGGSFTMRLVMRSSDLVFMAGSNELFALLQLRGLSGTPSLPKNAEHSVKNGSRSHF